MAFFFVALHDIFDAVEGDLSRPMALPFLNQGFMPARLFIIAHTYEQDFSGKACEGSGVAFFLDLPDGRIGGLVPLELDDERRFLRVLRARQEREVGKALARRQLAHDVVEPPCAVKSEFENVVVSIGNDAPAIMRTMASRKPSSLRSI